MPQAQIVSHVDVRQIAPADRHALIFNTFAALQVGEALSLVNDHRPNPLAAQFAERFAGQYQWTYLLDGPALWQVTIAKVSDARLGAPCCGHCNG
ncbi:DUF2249 domain-containing protein [uncultured Deefgea sp.]|uniref:DUF2249 domain-containing protein n=1 Tax=uncultured Deefgea sp. TaxID=1304914 RepID=UPI00260E67D5|nr:DUF2249 domain-containing protein [uncultured Deefgea sp.]